MASASTLDELLERAGAVLAELGSVDLDGIDGQVLGDALGGLQRLRGRLDVAEARVLSRFDAQRAWEPSGAKTAAAWVAWTQRLPIGVARQRLRHARAMRALPSVEAAWSDGLLDRSHVVALLAKRTPRTRAVFDADHRVLLDAALRLGFKDFTSVCDRWEQIVDPDGAEQDAEAEHAAREVHLDQSFAGMWFGRLTLDRVSGAIVDETLREIDQELFDADWAAARHRLGRTPTPADLARTPAQRRADALVEMATRARTAPADGRRPAPLFTVVVGLETLKGPVLELFNRTALTPGTAARHLTHADVERIVFDPPSRVLDVGERRRFFRGALRRAIEVRDRVCFHPSCDEVPQRPEADHIHPAAHGGPTTQDNGRWGCAHHNRWRTTHPDQPPPAGGPSGDDGRAPPPG